MKFFVSDLGIQPDHPLRKKWCSHQGRHDPKQQNALRVVTVALFLGVILLPIGCIRLEANHNDGVAFLLIMIGLFLPFAGIFTGLFGMINTFENAIRLLCEDLGLRLDQLRLMPWTALETNAFNRLQELAEIVKTEEAMHPKNPYHVNRLTAKRKFEMKYETFLSWSLITDVGYGSFYQG